MKRFLLLLLSFTALLAQPAAADHALYRWGGVPKVCIEDTSIWVYSARSERTWVAAGFTNGFVVGPCSPEEAAASHITVAYGELPDSDGLAEFKYTPEGLLTACHITIEGRGPFSLRQSVLDHEYGHCLGLAHPAEPSAPSLMTPIISLLFPSAHDQEALKELYS